MRLAVALFCTMVALPAWAEVTTGDVIKNYHRGDKAAYYYLAGVIHGVEWMNIAAEHDLKQKVFCQPDMAITTDQALSILEEYVKRFPDTNKQPVGLAVTLSYLDVFPCKKHDE